MAGNESTSALITPQTFQKLTIREISLTPIVVPLDGVYRGSYYRMENRASVITRVVTEEGIVGEAYAADEDKTLADIVGVIRDEIAPRLIGQNAFAYERCWELGYPVTYDQLRDRRIGLVALACVDFAIWDAIGKALGQPLWQLWGGYRDRIPGQHHRRLLRPRPRRDPRRGRRSGARWASAAASSRSARSARPRTPTASAPHARPPATTS